MFQDAPEQFLTPGSAFRFFFYQSSLPVFSADLFFLSATQGEQPNSGRRSSHSRPGLLRIWIGGAVGTPLLFRQ